MPAISICSGPYRAFIQSFLIVFPILWTLSGCANPTGTPSADGVPKTEVASDTNVTRSRPVDRMIEKARALVQNGRLRKAERTLDRGLNIRPDHPEIWFVLARIRELQNRLGQAEMLARKSNELSRDRVDLRIKIWRLIARVRYMNGDWDGSRRARDRVDSLTQQRER